MGYGSLASRTLVGAAFLTGIVAAALIAAVISHHGMVVAVSLASCYVICLICQVAVPWAEARHAAAMAAAAATAAAWVPAIYGIGWSGLLPLLLWVMVAANAGRGGQRLIAQQTAPIFGAVGAVVGVVIIALAWYAALA